MYALSLGMMLPGAAVVGNNQLMNNQEIIRKKTPRQTAEADLESMFYSDHNLLALLERFSSFFLFLTRQISAKYSPNFQF